MMRAVLLWLAVASSAYATASYLTGFTADFKVSAVIAVLCLGGVFWRDYQGREHDRRIADERVRTWARRDRGRW